MWKWLRRLGSETRDTPTAGNAPSATASFIERRMGGSAKYLALYRYLENRYADVTVLTFDQIEDVLGFTLPSLARTTAAWWQTGATNGQAPQSAAWILAGRTATPNLLAKTVLFERTPPPGRKRGSDGAALA
jgi:hypothetical protein